MEQEEGQAQEQPDQEAALEASLNKYLDAEEKREEEEEKEPEAEEQEEPPEKTIELDPEAPIFELTVKGEGGLDVPKKVSLKELQAGYMMQADYQRKTAEVERQRAEVDTAVKTKTAEAEQRYEAQLNQLNALVRSSIDPDLQNVDWVNLAATDPAKYTILRAKAEKFAGTIQALEAERNKLAAQRTQEQTEARNKAAQESVERLKQDIPGWNQDKYQSILKGAVEKLGFKPEEVTQVVDHRIIKVLNDALAYQELKSAKPIAEKKVVSVPKVVRPGSPDKDSDQIADRKKAALTKLRKSGDVEDAAAAIFNMI